MSGFLKNGAVLLVCKNAHNVDQLFPIEVMADGFFHLIRCPGIVGTIHNKQRLPADHCKSSLPACMGKSILSLFHGSMPSQLIQNFKCLKSQHRVLLLVNSRKGNVKFLSLISKALPEHALLPQNCLVRVCYCTGNAQLLTGFRNDLYSFRLLSGGYRPAAWLDNAGFFLCNFFQGISKK